MIFCITRFAAVSRLIMACGLLLTTGCKTHKTPNPTATNKSDSGIILTIDPNKTYQTIRHFGASDAWSCQFVGLWPDAKKNAIADLLFSTDTLANGQPKGIGLSLWRFNIGAGTAEQGNNSGIKDEWRRAGSFLIDDGTYNWNKQAGQMWFLTAAKERGVPYFLAFPNSPPVQYTINGKGYASNKMPNLNADRFDDFGQYMARVVEGIRTKTGITFNYLSPVNEPQWDWSDGGQEGTPFFNNQIAGITRSLSKALLDSKLPTKIDIAEAGQLDFLFSDHGRPGKGNQIHAFFNPLSDDYVGNLPNLTKAISAHSYFTTSPAGKATDIRKQVLTSLNEISGLEYWMSEYCILGDNAGEINGSGKDLGIDPALYVAKVMHNDLVNAQASAWHWWIAISPYNYKDGLIYIDKDKTDGNFQPSKMLWAMGNYSRFVRPGAKRIDASLNQNSGGLLVSSYLNTNQQLVTVLVNPGTDPQQVKTALASGHLTNLATYTTSANADLAPVRVSNPSASLTIQGKSVVTLVGTLTN